ncbi:twin-arginine translocase subunit TatC [Halomicrobium sp. IBSBa]|uniref:twin-arginine translocase subunit TatC n=1 Tax=Halomicrobium sp. IBSBa TaxID=2778916 RepID=UPI001ABF527F|nr:twin-arginine translocase subunit TatC [Halomicrobium sp. IBSBa]MBO4247812.1 twin-arginine translocase subunit TatC [Halomicrobium sp. IBSBa]
MSTGLDEDTMRSVQSGRETMGSMLRAAQKHLQKVFIVWVVGLVGTIYALQEFLWDRLKADMIERTAEEADIVAVTPFDVILLQVKIGAVIGILLALPFLIYYSRDALRERDLWPADRVPLWKLWSLLLIAIGLFAGGILYSYNLFFPLMFDFLAENADAAGFRPDYSITKWVGFVALLGFSFGLAAQLPLFMSALSYTGIVPYETFRDRWRVAVVLIFGFGALFSPPDPFTQVMWALPLVGLYVVSLGISKILVLTKRAGEEVGAATVARTRWNKLAAGAVVAGGAVYYLLATPAFQYIQAFAAWFPSDRLTGDIARPDLLGLGTETTAIAIAAVFGVVAAIVVLYYYMIKALDVAAAEAGNYGDPTAIDIEPLSAGAVRSAPVQRFQEMEEQEALELAQSAMDDGNPDKAEAILGRWDFAQDTMAGTGEAADDGDEEDADVVTSTTAGVMNAFTEEETTEDDIGGYYHDIAFILDSLTSKAIWFVGTFMAISGAAFVFLYSGGIGDIRNTFVSNLPPSMRADVTFVNLHPVEHLIFIVKFSAILGAVSVLPLLVYFAWPALKERGFVGGQRGVLGIWSGTVIASMIGGSLVGFTYVAPTVISWLAFDVLQSGMIISYRVAKFGWLVLALTVGIGLLFEIPVTMLLFHRGNIITFQSVQDRWRTVTLGVFVAGALFSPKGIFTMFLVSIPVTIAFLVGLGVLWLYTLGGRRAPEGAEPAD